MCLCSGTLGWRLVLGNGEQSTGESVARSRRGLNVQAQGRTPAWRGAGLQVPCGCCYHAFLLKAACALRLDNQAPAELVTPASECWAGVCKWLSGRVCLPSRAGQRIARRRTEPQRQAPCRVDAQSMVAPLPQFPSPVSDSGCQI